MLTSKITFVYLLLVTLIVTGKHKKAKPKKFVSPSTKGIQCYNCLSFDHPGCWDPDHPDYANITAIETGQEIGPVRARTCVPAKDFSKKSVSYSMCSKLSKELSASEIFSRIAVSRPQCTLCKKHLCTDAVHC
ncbi:hypothetical protein RR46_08414 [Papilio xuthus]|uniref:Uncharacterized protein n=1 Tax=Papilio xuthus TaxID=66420 RepID=A0A194PG33_PAPXU|nr:hypothetical protein RR46_08414 [Papilio xuthus]